MVLIFETLWHLILFGFCSEDQSRLAARKYARVVQKLGFPVSSIYLEQFSLVWVLKLIQSFSSLALLWYVIDLKSLLLLVILSKVKLKPIMLHSQKDLILGSQELPSDSRTCNTLVAPWFNDPNNRQVHPQHHRSIRHTLAQWVLNSLWLLMMAQ